jgi:hypothetical protein
MSYTKEQARRHYVNHKDEYSKRFKEYYHSHKELLSIKNKLWRKNNRDKTRAANIRYREKHMDRILARRNQYFRENPDVKRRIRNRYQNKHSEKTRARWIYQNALRSGKIKHQNQCSVCPNDKFIHGHHPDYSKPLEVIWLCPKCHKLAHLLADIFGKIIIEKLAA